MLLKALKMVNFMLYELHISKLYIYEASYRSKMVIMMVSVKMIVQLQRYGTACGAQQNLGGYSICLQHAYHLRYMHNT